MKIQYFWTWKDRSPAEIQRYIDDGLANLHDSIDVLRERRKVYYNADQGPNGITCIWLVVNGKAMWIVEG